MLYNISVFFSFLQSVIGFTLMSSSTMRFREPVKKRVITGLFVMLSGISLLSYQLFAHGMDSVDRFAILVILVIQLSWFLICSDDRFFVSLFSFLTFVNIYVSISYISDTLAMHLDGSAFVIGRIVIRLGIYLVIIPLLFKYVRPRFRRLVDALDKEWRAAVLVPLIFLIMQIMVLYYPAPYWYWTNDNWYRFIIITVYMLFLAVYYLLYIQANAIVEKYVLEKRHLLMAQQEKLWESELARQKATAALVFQQRHDMHHHNAVIIEMLQNGDTDQLKTYMKSFESASDAYKADSFCTNPIANSIFNVYARRAEAEGIKTTYNVSVPKTIGIDNIDLTCVLGNALENAVEGCMRLSEDEEKEIKVTAKFIDKRLRFQVENTCRSDIEFEGELPLTQKEGGGTGTKSILYTAERYDGTAGFSIIDGKSTIIVEVKKEVIDSKIDEAVKNNTTGTSNVIQIPVSDTKSEVAKVELTGDIVRKLEENKFDVSVKWDNVEYIIPAEEFNISKVAETLNIQETDLKAITVDVRITKLDEQTIANYNEVAKLNGAELIFPPVSFEVVAKTTRIDGSTEEVKISKFSNYVERVMEIPVGMDKSKITTGIVFNSDGTYSHVPTSVFQKDGKWYASINSLTNSIYSIIWNPIIVTSVENHWSKSIVNDMASRLVIKNPETFMPDQNITRGEFAEYITKAIGIFRLGAVNTQKFSDVEVTHGLAYAIQISSEYGIISGYPDGSFKPSAKISREEAMVMYSRAMDIAGLEEGNNNRIESYIDKAMVADWAYNDVKKTLSAGVFNGKTTETINPKDNFTFAEAATAIRNLLVASGLIND